MNASEKTDYESEKLTIDCPNIVLEPISGENLKRLNGPGLIIQKSGGGFLLKVFIAERSNLKELIDRINRLKSGKLIGSSEYYRMLAADLKGREWKCDRLYPHTSSGPNGSVLTADLLEITDVAALPKHVLKSSLEMRFKGNFKIPANSGTRTTKQIADIRKEEESKVNVCEFSSRKMDLGIIQEDEWMIVTASSARHEFNERKAYRIKEAIQLCMGRQLEWSTMTLVKGGKECTFLRGIIQNEKRGRFYPPINYHEYENVDDAIRLMDCYLAKTINYKETSVHPLFRPLYAVILASESTTESEALTLATSIESILNVVNIGIEQDAKAIECLKQLRKHLKSQEYPTTFKDRISGLLGMMENPSATQKLNHLVKEGITSRDLVNAWKTLRPKLAHGNYAIGDFQGFLDKVHAVHVLLHHLLFHGVGYQGGYTDYAKEDWPMLKYPNPKD